MIHRIFIAVLVFASLAGPSQSTAAENPSEGERRVERFLTGLDGFHVRFNQTLSDRSGATIEESNGTLAVWRPNRFRWEYREPHEQVIVADGKRIWLYDSDLEQVTVRKLDDTLSATPAMLLGGEGKLADNFTVKQMSTEAGVQWVRMEPKRNDTDFKWVRLGFTGETLKYMQLADKLGQTTLLEFSQFERNPPVDPSRFTFSVPPGADVIGDPSGTDSKSPAPQR